MKGFEMGVSYLRKVAVENKLIEESDNDDVLVERLAKVLKGEDPFEDKDAKPAPADDEVNEDAE